MADTPDYIQLAEADGATFARSPLCAWSARDRDGMVIVRGAMSKAEAARIYCEQRGLLGEGASCK